MPLGSIRTVAARIGYAVDPKLQDLHITGKQRDKQGEPQ